MSGGSISEDRKIVCFEVNLNGMICHFTLNHIDSTDELNPAKIHINLRTEAHRFGSTVISRNCMIIDKNYTKILSHWFRYTADVMDEWYKDE